MKIKELLPLKENPLILIFLTKTMRISKQYKPMQTASKEQIDYDLRYNIQSNFNGSNTFGTMKISSRQG